MRIKKKCASSSSLNIDSIYCSTTCTFLEKSKRSERAFRILEKIIVVSPQKTKMKGLAAV